MTLVSTFLVNTSDNLDIIKRISRNGCIKKIGKEEVLI